VRPALRFPAAPADLRSSNLLRHLKHDGPGAILASVTIGSGETIFASRLRLHGGWRVALVLAGSVMTALGLDEGLRADEPVNGRMTMRRRHAGTILIALLIAGASSAPLRADALSGSWQLESYTGPASHGTASGLLVFADGQFSLVYTMDEGRDRWGRAHAGRYAVDGDTLTYAVEWDIQYVKRAGVGGAETVGAQDALRRERRPAHGDVRERSGPDIQADSSRRAGEVTHAPST
jgi:hypothetical protein